MIIQKEGDSWYGSGGEKRKKRVKKKLNKERNLKIEFPPSLPPPKERKGKKEKFFANEITTPQKIKNRWH